MTTKKRKRKYDIFYVVTRDGRRIEERDYWIYRQASERADQLRSCLRQWADKDAKKIAVIKTQDPRSIY